MLPLDPGCLWTFASWGAPWGPPPGPACALLPFPAAPGTARPFGANAVHWRRPCNPERGLKEGQPSVLGAPGGYPLRRPDDGESAFASLAGFAGAGGLRPRRNPGLPWGSPACLLATVLVLPGAWRRSKTPGGQSPPRTRGKKGRESHHERSPATRNSARKRRHKRRPHASPRGPGLERVSWVHSHVTGVVFWYRPSTASGDDSPRDPPCRLTIAFFAGVFSGSPLRKIRAASPPTFEAVFLGPFGGWWKRQHERYQKEVFMRRKKKLRMLTIGEIMK